MSNRRELEAAEYRRTPKRGRHCESLCALASWSAAMLRRFLIQKSNGNFFGSSMQSFTLIRKVTASFPSIAR